MLKSEHTEKVYFYNLDGIRALACISVFLGHFYDYIDNYKIDNPIEKWLVDHVFNGLGAIGVNLFFVLSGFLISYFLFSEKKQTNKIDLKHFYFKRILRIWPVFFLVVFLSFIIIPILCNNFQFSVFSQHFPFYLFFINNFDRIHTHFTGINSDSLGALWSVAVEEQFYLIWPIFIFFIKPKQIPFLFTIVIIISVFFRSFNLSSADELYYNTISLSGDLIIGASLAYLCVYSNHFVTWFRKTPRVIILLIYVLTISLIINSKNIFSHPFLIVSERIIFSLCFAFIIAEQNFCDNSLFKFKNLKMLSNFSVITYGFYCYHLFFIMLVQKMNLIFKIESLGSPLFYLEFVLTFILCYFFSLASYYLFEKKFLALKK